MIYSEKLKDPRWQKKRLEIFRRDRWRCQLCDSKDKTLCVHHKVYMNGKNPWEISNSKLITLCDDCHQKIYGAKDRPAISVTKKDLSENNQKPFKANGKVKYFSSDILNKKSTEKVLAFKNEIRKTKPRMASILDSSFVFTEGDFLWIYIPKTMENGWKMMKHKDATFFLSEVASVIWGKKFITHVVLNENTDREVRL